MAERSKAPDSRVKLFLTGVFWSTNVGVGSNPTSDKCFRCEEEVRITKHLGTGLSLSSEKGPFWSFFGIFGIAFHLYPSIFIYDILWWNVAHFASRNVVRGTSSNGRALDSHSRGTGIDTPVLQFMGLNFKDKKPKDRLGFELATIIHLRIWDKRPRQLSHKVEYKHVFLQFYISSTIIK